jgi:hypothetical protein
LSCLLLVIGRAGEHATCVVRRNKVSNKKGDSHVQKTGLDLAIHSLRKWHWLVISVVVVDIHGIVVTISQVHHWVRWLLANEPELEVEDSDEEEGSGEDSNAKVPAQGMRSRDPDRASVHSRRRAVPEPCSSPHSLRSN